MLTAYTHNFDCPLQFQLVPKNVKKRPRQHKRKQSSDSPAFKKVRVQERPGLGDDGGSSFATGVRKSRRLTGLVSFCA